MRAEEIRKNEINELYKLESEYSKELFNLRFQQATGQLENTQRIPKVKKNIARIKTIIWEKEMESSHV